MAHIKLTDLVQKVYREYPDKLISTFKVQPPDINKIFEKLDQEFENQDKVIYLHKVSGKRTSKKLGIFKKVSILTASIIILSILISAIVDTPQVKALKFNIVNIIIRIKDQLIEITNEGNGTEDKASDHTNESTGEFTTIFKNIDEARNRIGTILLLPTELPAGYELDWIEWSKYDDQRQYITQIYKNKQDLLEISQLIDSVRSQDKTFIQNIDGSFAEEVVVDNRHIVFTKLGGKIKRAVWYEDDSRCEIIGNLTEEEIVNIIKSLDKSPE